MKKFVPFILLFSLISLLSCETVEKHKGATTGAAIGAGTGALIGAVLSPEGKQKEGALIGGLFGALVGGAIGHYAYDMKRNQKETNSLYQFRETSPQVRIEEASITPKVAKQGERVTTRFSYALLTTSETPVRVREKREIYFMDQLWGNPEVVIERQGGTYVSELPIILPKNVRKGTYRVKFIVQTENSSDTREETFTVQ